MGLRYNHCMSKQSFEGKECFNFLHYIGCKVDKSDKDSAGLSIEICKEHMQHLGYVHGGVISTLADNTGWFVLKPYLDEKQTAVTQELTVNYLHPGKGKKISSVGKLIKLGKGTAFVSVEVFCDDKLIATSTSHLAILDIKE